MPKIAKERSDQNRRRIETAALELFTSQGFHGTNNRDIADKLGISTGALYTYFPSKEAIFASVSREYLLHLRAWIQETIGRIEDPLSPAGLRAMASAIQVEMYEGNANFLMLLSDVIEFKNQHFLELFHDVPQQLRDAMNAAFETTKKRADWRGEDPAFAMASAYLYFFTYFLMEKHMQGAQHLGLPDDEATACFVDLLCNGLWRTAPGPQGHNGQGLDSQRDRIDYVRFLSGRLWSRPPDAAPNDGDDLARRPILFLPEVPKKRIDDNQLRIEAAALELFTRQGFHGTNIREVAIKAEVSQGLIYIYYPSKEAIFEGLVRTYRHSMRNFLERVFRILEDPFSRNGLTLFAAAMRSMVYDDAEYWLLMYLDVVEFRNRHFLTAFHDVPAQFRRLLGPSALKVRDRQEWCGRDPALVMAMIYFYFHTYFVVERLMHGDQHLGVTDGAAIERMVDILSHGLWGNTGANRLQAD